MLALPDLGAAPPLLRESGINSLAAKLALALAGNGPIHAPRREVQGIEIDILQQQLQRWLRGAIAELELFQPRIHVALGVGPIQHSSEAEPDKYTVWLSPSDKELIGSVWCLERRWRALEAKAPGLAPAALIALDHAGRHSLPLYTPEAALYFACHAWWWGEETEEYILAEYREEVGKPDAPPPDDMPTRANFDKAMPREVTEPRTRLKRTGLERLSRRRGEIGDIARGILELQDLCATAHRRRKSFEFRSTDEEGFRAASYAAAIRWNSCDPVFRAFDDYTNEAYESGGAENAYGWFEMKSSADLPRLLAELEQYFRIARAVERLLPMVAVRQRA